MLRVDGTEGDLGSARVVLSPLFDVRTLAQTPARAVMSSLVFAGLVGCGDAGGPRVVTRLVLTGLPSSVIAGTPVTYTATAKDASGTTVTDYSGTVHFTS